MQWVQRVPWRSLGRWWIVGLAFFAGGIGILYLFVDILRWPLPLATLVASEVTVVLRFLINDRWVFGHPRPSWMRLWQFHAASAGGAAIWWTVANTLPRFGVHYLIASTAGTACSVVFSMISNFLWVWRGRADRRAPGGDGG
jgi:putative flippase GtrA